MTTDVATRELWPALPLEEWRDTYATLHMWTQMVGKTCLALAPRQNHWWQVALRVTARGLATSLLPYGARTLDAEFDFIEHELVLRTGEGAVQKIALRPRSVAAFYRAYLAALDTLGMRVKIWPVPVEAEHKIRFPDDEQHAAYDPDYANRHWRILVQIDDVFKRFRAPFLGKCSPVHFFWGSFDLAVTRFSGRRAPERPGADRVTGTRARGLARPRPTAQRRVLPEGYGHLHPALHRRPDRQLAWGRAAGVPPEYLRRCRGPREVGPRSAGAPALSLERQ